MKHVKKMTVQRPSLAQLDLGTVLTALSQVMQVVGTMLVEKEALNMDPYDYSTSDISLG